MRQHGPPFVGNIQNIAMTFAALVIIERGVRFFAVFLVVVFILQKMGDDIFEAVHGFGIEKIHCIMRGGKVAVHAVGHESLGIVDMGGGSPCVNSKTDFMAGGAEPGGGGSYHGIIGHAEQRKPDYHAQADQQY